MIRIARPLDAGKVGKILSDIVDNTDQMRVVHSKAEYISFAGKMIDQSWVKVFEQKYILGFIARNAENIYALYVEAAARGQGIGTALLNDAKLSTSKLALTTLETNYRARKLYRREGFLEFGKTKMLKNNVVLPEIRLIWRKSGKT